MNDKEQKIKELLNMVESYLIAILTVALKKDITTSEQLDTVRENLFQYIKKEMDD